MSLNDLYNEIIMEHAHDKTHRHSVANCSHSERGHNPSCGDDITLELQVNNHTLEDVGFTGVGCAISTASSSMMIDLVKGKSLEEARMIADTFLKMIQKGCPPEDLEHILQDAYLLGNIATMPARVKCAVLAWRTLEEALNKIEEKTS